MASDITFKDIGGSEDERVRGYLDEAVGHMVQAGADWERAMEIGEALYHALDDLLGFYPGPLEERYR